MKFYEQLEQIIKGEETDLTPHEDWDIEDYKALHYHIKKGWILSNATIEPYECEGQHDYYMINHYYNGEKDYLTEHYKRIYLPDYLINKNNEKK